MIYFREIISQNYIILTICSFHSFIIKMELCLKDYADLIKHITNEECSDSESDARVVFFEKTTSTSNSFLKDVNLVEFWESYDHKSDSSNLLIRLVWVSIRVIVAFIVEIFRKTMWKLTSTFEVNMRSRLFGGLCLLPKELLCSLITCFLLMP